MSDELPNLITLAAQSIQELLAEGNTAEADQLVQLVLNTLPGMSGVSGPQAASSLIFVAQYLLASARAAEAAAVLERVSAYYSQAPEYADDHTCALYLQALAADMTGDRPRAREFLLAAGRLMPEDRRQGSIYGEVHQRLSDLLNQDDPADIARLVMLNEALYIQRAAPGSGDAGTGGIQLGEDFWEIGEAQGEGRGAAPDDFEEADEDSLAGTTAGVYPGEDADAWQRYEERNREYWTDAQEEERQYGNWDPEYWDQMEAYLREIETAPGDEPEAVSRGGGQPVTPAESAGEEEWEAAPGAEPPAQQAAGEESTAAPGVEIPAGAAGPPPAQTGGQPETGSLIDRVVGMIGTIAAGGTITGMRIGKPTSAAQPPPASGGAQPPGGEGELEEAVEQTSAIPSMQPAPPPRPSTLIRYPALDCPNRTVMGERFSLFVQLLTEAPTPVATALAIADRGDPGKPPEIEVVLRSPAFELAEGSNTRTMTVSRSGESEERFVLIPREAGEHTIRVDFYQFGRRLGTERRQVTVEEMTAAPEPAAPETRRFTAAAGDPVVLSITPEPTIPPPDLEIVVLLDHDGTTLRFELHSTREEVGYHRFPAGTTALAGPPIDRLQALFKEVSSLARSMAGGENDDDGQGEARHFGQAGDTGPAGLSAQEAERRLARLGNQLWDELIPEPLKTEYWNFRTKVKTLLVTSEEPWVPWEMIKPYRFDDQGLPQDDPYWCQQFALSRWLSGQGPADLLRVSTALPITPLQSDLPAIAAEIAFLTGLPNLRPQIRLLSPLHALQEVRERMETGDVSMLHFACHGMFDSSQPMNSAILLSGGALRPSDLRLRFGGMRPRPLVFINACHGGRVNFSFTGLGGWATRMVAARVGAFIGAMWEVDDDLALVFARRFYTALLKDGLPLAEAFRSAREEVRQASPYNSTWLAYVLYADPECRVLS